MTPSAVDRGVWAASILIGGTWGISTRKGPCYQGGSAASITRPLTTISQQLHLEEVAGPGNIPLGAPGQRTRLEK